LSRWLVAAAAAGLSQIAAAGLRERLQDFDLNDFAVGAGFAAMESPYAGVRDSVSVYPAIASLFPGAFDDDLAFNRDGGYGVRWAPPSGLELGALIRYQSLGFESSDSPALAGLPDRPWTLEIGPSIGWRAWPVHVDYTAFVDLLRHHTGASQMLRFSLPKRWERSYVIPEIGLRRYGTSFVDYYFGVPGAAATADRPAYAGSAADGWSAGVSWGAQLGPRWLVSGRVSVEEFGSAISASPIVETDRRGYVSLQAAYLQPLWRSKVPAAGASAALDRPAVTLTMAAAAADTHAWLTSLAERAGADRAGDAALAYLDAGVRLGGRHRLEIERYAASRDSAAVGAELDDWRASYAFAALDDPQKEVTVDAGLHVMRLDLELAGTPAAGATRRSPPLPALGVSAEARFPRKLAVTGQLRWSLLDLDPREGRRLFISVGMTHRTFAHVALGFGYVLDRLSLDLGDSVTSALDLDYRGPSFTVTGYF
jgi:outer membrane scaffolding protein for murein synthesis (MipA/OmpV family)